MTDYVLEILDGDQAGTVIDLRGDRLRVGRRPDNDLVLNDEKCSGHHAEIVVEDGRHVLRDLDSTNGTMIDDKRVTEVALTGGDVFQLGRVRVAFRAAGSSSAAAGDDAELHVGKIDAARLQRSRRRGGSLLLSALFVLVLAAGGAFYFLQSGGGGGGGPVGGKSSAPLKINGNKLATGVGDFEGEAGWIYQGEPTALAFEPTAGRARVHSGTGAVAAVGVDEAGAAGFAIARTSGAVGVIAGQPLRVSGFIKTTGEAKIALRVVFSAATGELPELRTGTTPQGAATWTEATFDCRVPRGADRAAVELLALVPSQADEAVVDDVAVLLAGEAAAIDGSVGGVTVIGSGQSLRIDAARAPVLLGVEPLVATGVLAELGRAGLLVPSDLGMTLSVATDDRGFKVGFASVIPAGLRLLLPPESANPRIQTDASGFQSQAPEFEAALVSEILVGGADSRALIRCDPPVTVRGRPDTAAWALDLVGAQSFALRVLFGPESLAADALLRDARAANERGHPGAALSKIDELVAAAPHDVESLRHAQELRATILTEQQRRVDALLRDGDEASFFEAGAGFRAVLDGIDHLTDDYGAEGLTGSTALATLQVRMRDGLAAVEARASRERAELLNAMALAFESSGDGALATLVRGYVERHAKSETGEQPEEKDK